MKISILISPLVIIPLLSGTLSAATAVSNIGLGDTTRTTNPGTGATQDFSVPVGVDYVLNSIAVDLISNTGSGSEYELTISGLGLASPVTVTQALGSFNQDEIDVFDFSGDGVTLTGGGTYSVNLTGIGLSGAIPEYRTTTNLTESGITGWTIADGSTDRDGNADATALVMTVDATAVPEPSSSLFVLTAALVGFTRRRR